MGSQRLQGQHQQRQHDGRDEGGAGDGEGVALVLDEPGDHPRCGHANQQNEQYQRNADYHGNPDGAEQQPHDRDAEGRTGRAEEAVEGEVQSAPRAINRFRDGHGRQHLPALGGQGAHAPHDQREHSQRKCSNEAGVQHASSSTGVASSERTATSVSVTGSPNVREKRL